MDFETIMPSIPMFNNTHSYQQIPTQYSLHIQSIPFDQSDWEISMIHKQFLADHRTCKDPRIAFIQQLLIDVDLNSNGSILVYNKSFEESRLKEIAKAYPEYASDIQFVINRLIDLALPFQRKYYYTHEMNGSYSIKKVLPAMVPSLSTAYHQSNISEGLTASNTFMELILNNEMGIYKDDTIQQKRQDLLDYCKLDTWAMVKILEKLLQLTQ